MNVFSLSNKLTIPLNTPVFLPVSVNRMSIAFDLETTPLHTFAVVVLILDVFHCIKPATTGVFAAVAPAYRLPPVPHAAVPTIVDGVDTWICAD